MRFPTCALILFAACGTVHQPGDTDIPPGDDDTTTPDASDPNAPLAIQVIATSIKDERGDVVTFDQGVPHHVHAGAVIALGGDGCPDVFKYGYLLDTAAPAFGGEDTANPLGFAFSANGLAIGEYRVRTESATLLDWTTASGTGNDFVAELHRNGSRGIAELGTFEGKLLIDMRVRDASGEQIATACWKHHPIAAPIEVSPLVPSTAPDAIPSFSIAGTPNQITQVMSATSFPIYETSYTQGTAEPVKLHIELPIPKATMTKLGVLDIVPVSTPTSIACGAVCGLVFNCQAILPTDPRCGANAPPVDPLDAPATAPLGSGTWAFTITDGAGNAVPECTFESSLSVTCEVPARKAGEASLTRNLVVTLGGISDLRPSDGVISKRTLDGLPFLGPPASQMESHCTHFTLGTMDGNGHIPKTCDTLSTSFQMAALDSFAIDFDPATLLVSSAVPGNALVPVPYAASGVTGAGFRWDGGTVDLPGSSH